MLPYVKRHEAWRQQNISNWCFSFIAGYAVRPPEDCRDPESERSCRGVRWSACSTDNQPNPTHLAAWGKLLCAFIQSFPLPACDGGGNFGLGSLVYHYFACVMEKQFSLVVDKRWKQRKNLSFLHLFLLQNSARWSHRGLPYRVWTQHNICFDTPCSLLLVPALQ